MRDLITSVLDLLGLLLLAAGAVAGLWPLIGGSALAVGGAVLLVGSQAAARLGDRS